MMEMDTGPIYPAIPSALKWRRKANAAGSIAAMDPADVAQYGQAVLDAVNTMNRAKLKSAYTPPPCHCASGSPSNDGKKILAHIRAQQNAYWRSA